MAHEKKKKKSLKSSLFGGIEESNLFDGSHLSVKNFSQSSFCPSKDRLSQPGCDCMDNV